MVLRCALACLASGLIMVPVSVESGSPALWYISGVVYALAFIPFLMYGPTKPWKRFFSIWLAVVTTTVLCLWSESLIFVRQTPEERSTAFIGSFLIYTVLAAVLTVLSVLLKVNTQPTADERSYQLRWFTGVLGAGVAYALYYYIFGALAFQFFTKPYYTATSGPLSEGVRVVARLGFWFPLIQVARGVVMTIGVLPIVGTLRMSRAKAAIAVGILLWVIGGLAPLLVPNPIMPPQLRLMHIVEIFTQNYLLGITAVYLLRKEAVQAQFKTAGRFD